MTHKMPELPYAKDALEPHISRETIEYHYGKHLQAYVDNLNKLIPTMEYSKYTMRGGSELTPEHDLESNDGLDLDYATAWSYGIEETPNLMIPEHSLMQNDSNSAVNYSTMKPLRIESVFTLIPAIWQLRASSLQPSRF